MLAGSLLEGAIGRDARKDCQALCAAYQTLFEELYRHLGQMIGLGGVAAVFRRAGRLASTESALLRELRIDDHGITVVETCDAMHISDPRIVEHAFGELLAAGLEVLVALIGVDLAQAGLRGIPNHNSTAITNRK